MTTHTTYTRVYSGHSAGELASGRGPTGHPLTENELLVEFGKHADLNNRIPPALVSVSNRIVDTTYRAFHKHYVDGESPADIWMVFIQVPLANGNGTGTPVRLHSARGLAKQGRQRLFDGYACLDPTWFHYEFVFEWGIPEDYVEHKVSLQTLMDRGLRIGDVSSTKEFRVSSSREFEGGCPFEIGLSLGFFARNFGARAPLTWIAHQLYYDCVRPWVDDDGGFDMVTLRYAHLHRGSERVELDRGVETALLDWWLADNEFALNYKEFERWKKAVEDDLAWEHIEFWERWHAGDDEPFEWDFEEGSLPWHVLSGMDRKKREEIEAEAVRIGL